MNIYTRNNTNLGEFELLLDIGNLCLTLQTQECARDQLGVDGVCPHHLPADLQEGPYLGRRQLTHSVDRCSRLSHKIRSDSIFRSSNLRCGCLDLPLETIKVH